MANLSTKMIAQHTIVVNEDERLTILAALRYRLAHLTLNATCQAETQGLIATMLEDIPNG